VGAIIAFGSKGIFYSNYLIFSFKPGKSAANILPAIIVGRQQDYG
jgi:hypothetical protein